MLRFFVLFFSLFALYVCNNSYTVMGGQHRWAPAYLAACHHIYFIVYYMYVSSLANKIVVVVVVVVAVYSYGPIYAVSLGSVSAVVLNNMCTISDAFEGKAHIFSDRPNWLPLMNLIYQERGMPQSWNRVKRIDPRPDPTRSQ